MKNFLISVNASFLSGSRRTKTQPNKKKKTQPKTNERLQTQVRVDLKAQVQWIGLFLRVLKLRKITLLLQNESFRNAIVWYRS